MVLAGIQQYYKRNIAIPSFDTLCYLTLKVDWKTAENHAEMFWFTTIGNVYTPEYKINEIAGALRKQFSADLPNHGMQLLNELRRWKTFWEEEMQQRRQNGGEEKPGCTINEGKK